MADLSTVVHKHLKARGMSLRALAKAVNHDPSYLSRVIRGIQPCHPRLARDIDDALNASGEVTALAEQAPDPAPDTERVRLAIETALSDGVMPAALLDDWEASADRYGTRTRDTPSPVLLTDLTADLAELHLAIGRYRSASALPRLALVVARMSGLVCLLYVKVGDRQAWRRWGRTARHAATEADDPPALSWATAQEAYGHFYAGDMPGAVASAHAAMEATRVPCVGRALAAALEMRAHAVMGDAASAAAAMKSAEQVHGALPGTALAPSAFGYAESQLRFHQGDALTILGKTSAALQVLDRALELCPPADYTDWALVRLNRAACTVLDGDPDAGLAYAAETLAALDAPRRLGVIAGRSRALLSGLTAAQRASGPARDLRTILEDTTGQKEVLA